MIIKIDLMSNYKGIFDSYYLFYRSNELFPFLKERVLWYKIFIKISLLVCPSQSQNSMTYNLMRTGLSIS